MHLFKKHCYKHDKCTATYLFKNHSLIIVSIIPNLNGVASYSSHTCFDIHVLLLENEQTKKLYMHPYAYQSYNMHNCYQQVV